ncbi:MAG: cardiolipin synthase [Lentisphaerae bacterium]|nr:cardiolipin synthase [Lentisphaerota bacterium]
MSVSIYNLLAAEPPWFWFSVEAALHIAVFLLVTYSCLKTRREATSALLWIFVAWSFPLIGPLSYLLFGINRVPRKAWRKQRADNEFRSERQARSGKSLAGIGQSLPLVYWRAVHDSSAVQPTDAEAQALNKTLDPILPDYPLLCGNAIEPLVDGDQAYPQMLSAIRGARHHVHLQTFIVWNDAISREFLDSLAEKARQGVRVRFMFDSFGSTGAVLSRLFFRYRRVPNMRIVGWTQANPLKRLVQLNLRNHRKILVVDGEKAFMGGINLRQENLARPGAPAIRDYHFAVSGGIVQELQYSFLRDWYFMTDEDPDVLLQPAHFPRLKAVGPALIRVANSGPTPDEMEILSKVFFECLVAARQRLLVATPYFVPPRDILQALCSAARRGVEVALVVPRINNHRYAGLAGQSLYDDVLKAGVRIYQRRAPFMHAKALIVDDILAFVGSANLDVRSLRLNYETNLIVYDPAFITALKQIVLNEIAASDELETDAWEARGQFQRILENFCNLLMPVL